MTQTSDRTATPQRPRLSIAMTTYNGEVFLAAQLASLAKQSRLPDEVVISDDASSDGTMRILKAFARTSPFSVEVSDARMHMGIIRNYESAIERCDGDLIALCDQDDIWLPGKLAAIEAAFLSAPLPVLVFSDGFLVDRLGRRTGRTLWGARQFKGAERGAFDRDALPALLRRSIVTGCTLAFRAEYRPLLTPFPPDPAGLGVRVFHDRWISMVLAAVGDLRPLDRPLIEYRLHPGQTVGIPHLTARRILPPSVLAWQQVRLPPGHVTSRITTFIELLHLAAKRVDDGLDGWRKEEALSRICRCLDHLEFRLATRLAPRSSRRPVFTSQRTGDYRHYSLGLASAVSDVVAPRTGEQTTAARRTHRSGTTITIRDYGPAVNVLRQPDLFSSRVDALGTGQVGTMLPLEGDGEERRHARDLLDHYFGRCVGDVAAVAAAAAKRLISGILAKGECEVRAEFCVPLTVHVLTHILGLSEAHAGPIQEMVDGPGNQLVDEAALERRRAGDLDSYFFRLFQQGDFGEGLLARLAFQGDRLSGVQAVRLARLIVIAGTTSPANVLTFAMRYLALRPRERQRLADSRELANAVEEFVRVATTASPIRRVATASGSIDGVTVFRGDLVEILPEAANRDLARFPHAHVVDLWRRPNPHLSFGAGVHRCVGAALGRLELQTALHEWHQLVGHYAPFSGHDAHHGGPSGPLSLAVFARTPL